MKITTKKSLEVTAPLEVYIDQKLSPLAKLIAHFEKDGEVELWLEVARTSAHHNKGQDVYMASAKLGLPHKVLHAEARADDIRVAIDKVREIFHGEIEKYKSQHADHHRGERNDK
jgi:ribosomal subunit interface protein